MNNNILDLYDLIQDVSWYFGNQGFDGKCCEDLSLIEYMVLKKVCEMQNIKIQQLGVLLNVTKSGVSKIVDRLERKSYVLRKQSLSDGRVFCVFPTDKGIQAIHKISNSYSEYLQETLKGLEAEELQNIKQNLELLFKAIKNKGFIKSD